ncbi:MAG: pentapeptide repeat-containing protein [Planctomycetota bacterium]
MLRSILQSIHSGSFLPLLLLFVVPSLCLAHTVKSEDITTVEMPDKQAGAAYADKNLQDSLLHGEPVRFDKDRPQKERTIDAEWIMKALEDGVEKINIENAIITGNLDFRIGKTYHVKVDEREPGSDSVMGPELNKPVVEDVHIVSTSISIKDSMIAGMVLAGEPWQPSDRVEFKKDISFRGTMLSHANFDWAVFDGGVDFSWALFEGDASFRGAVFKDKSDFHITTFQDRTDLSMTTFDDEANFLESTFQGEANFFGAAFRNNVDFTRAVLEGEALFSGASFGGNVNLRLASYSGLQVSWRQLKGRLDFPMKTLFDALEKLREEARASGKSIETLLQDGWPKGKGVLMEENYFVPWEEVYMRLVKDFDYTGEKGSKNDAYYHFRYMRPIFKTRRLGTVYEKVSRLPQGVKIPDDLSAKLRYDPETGYLSFKGVMSRRERNKLLHLSHDGPYRDAVESLYERSRQMPEYIVRHGWWEKTQEWAQYICFGLTCGYGVRPLRPLAALGALISVFALIYFSKKTSIDYQFREKDKKKGRYKNTHISQMPWYIRLYNCFYFSVVTFSALGYGDIKPMGGFKVAAIIECVLGIIIVALFVVTLSRVWLS